jgi:hypothetical protein
VDTTWRFPPTWLPVATNEVANAALDANTTVGIAA